MHLESLGCSLQFKVSWVADLISSATLLLPYQAHNILVFIMNTLVLIMNTFRFLGVRGGHLRRARCSAHRTSARHSFSRGSRVLAPGSVRRRLEGGGRTAGGGGSRGRGAWAPAKTGVSRVVSTH